LNCNRITYFFDGGGLLGCIRDGDLIPWDNDLDMLLPSNEYDKFCSIIPELKKRNWRVYTYKMDSDGPGWKKGDAKGIKIFNNFFLKFGRGRIVMDITVIYKNDGIYHRKAMGRTWKLPAIHLGHHSTFDYQGHTLKIPDHVEDYLTYLYGDWKKPDQNYDPLRDDKSLSRKGLITFPLTL
jgi:phosphorylcholine metabolism protein LicD